MEVKVLRKSSGLTSKWTILLTTNHLSYLTSYLTSHLTSYLTPYYSIYRSPLNYQAVAKNISK